ncbi:hypothetical protein AVEN_136264-1, partial [Araneus ventricosus]
IAALKRLGKKIHATSAKLVEYNFPR